MVVLTKTLLSKPVPLYIELFAVVKGTFRPPGVCNNSLCVLSWSFQILVVGAGGGGGGGGARYGSRFTPVWSYPPITLLCVCQK